MTETYDMVVVGAGCYGLSAAKAYLDLHGEQKVLVVEASETCGGTWSQHRLYPGLLSNNQVGSYEHPDLLMSEAVYGVKPGEHIPGPVLHRYYTDLAIKFGIYERTRFNTRVALVEPSAFGGGWLLHVSGAKGGLQIIETKRLIIATGLTSMPNMPQYHGQETLTVPFFHANDFYGRREMVNAAKRIVVIGGAKSAFDMAYAFASGGTCEVDMVIRENGQGPIWICPAYVTPLKQKTEELLLTRFLTWFSPCPWGAEDGFPMMRNFLQRTAIGRWIVGMFWTIMASDVINRTGYDSNPLVRQFKPWNSIRWNGTGVGINNYETNFFDLVKSGKVRVHTSDVSKLEGNTVYLDNGETLETDAVICSTGWKEDLPFEFKNPGEAGLGLPYSAETKAQLSSKADEEILNMFPILRSQPELKSKAPNTDPLRMYRFMIPPTMVANRNLAFAGMISTISTSISAAVQGLWITAYFDGKLDRIASNNNDITQEVMLHTQWGKWRYPCGYGARFPDIAFDSIPYLDLMLKDLGLPNHRKKNLVSEIFRPYKPTDYCGLIQEWEAAQDRNRMDRE